MADFLTVLILAAVLGAAIWYLVRSKKNGAACVGCPHSKTCSSHKAEGGCGCH